MNNESDNLETAELEALLFRQIPNAPASLRDNIDSTVRKNLKRQTLHDDLKWLGLCFSILLMVLAAQWLVLSSVYKNQAELSSMIASTESAKKLAMTIGVSPSELNQLSESKTTTE